MLTAVHFAATVLTVLALLPGAAHLFELPNKIDLDADDYLIVQQLYRGWARFGVVLLGSLATCAWFAALARDDARLFVWASVATACVAATLVIFFAFTYPANRATRNWTSLPDGWPRLRRRWEWSHAVNALLTLAAVVALLVPAFWPSVADRA